MSRLIKNKLLYGVLVSLCLIFNPQILSAQDISALRFFNVNFNTLSSPNSIITDLPAGKIPIDDEPTQVLGLDFRFPIKLKGRTKLIGAIGYDRELLAGITFLEEGEEDDFEQLTLHNPSLSFAVLHDFNERWSLKNNLKLQSRSDHFLSFGAGSLAFRNSILVERNKNNTTFGFGFSAGYSNNRFSILPLLLYKKELPSNWELDILLPSKVLAIKNLSRNNRLLFGARGNAGQYFFDNQVVNGFADLSYRRLNVNVLAGYERQLTPLVGVGIEAGVTVPLRSGLYQQDQVWQEVHNFGDRIAPYFNLKFFLSLPK